MILSDYRMMVLVISLALAGCGTKTPEDSITSANKALAQGDYKAAEVELKSVLQADPSNVGARLFLAKTYQEIGRWEDSEKELTKAREHGAALDDILPVEANVLIKLGKFQNVIDIPIPTFGVGSRTLAALHAERANAYLALGKPTLATQEILVGEKIIANASEGDATHTPLLLSKARLAFIENRRADAFQALEAIERLDANSIDALYLKAQLLNLEGKGEEAGKIYEKIVATKPHEILAHMAIVDSRLRVRDIDGAENALRAAEKHHPRSHMVMRARAKLAMLKGDFSRANAILQDLMRINPNHLPTVMMDAAVNYGLGNHERSLKSARKVLASAPGHLDSAKLVASNELHIGNHTTALEVLTPFLRDHGDDAKILELLAEAHIRDKQFDKAMNLLSRATDLRPRDTGLMQSKARLHLAQGQGEQALQAIQSAVVVSEGGGLADLNLIMLHISRQEFDRALTAIQNLDRKSPRNPVVSNLRGIAYLGAGNRVEARKAFELALSLVPSFFTAADNLARLDILENNHERARTRYLAVLKADVKNVPAMLALAALAKTNQNGKDALVWLEKAIAADANALDAHVALANFHLENKAPQRALSVARDAVSKHSDSPRALSLLASAQAATGNQTAALSTLSKVVEKAPNSADAHFRLGAALVVAGKAKDARVSLDRAQALDPGHEDAFNALLLLDAQEDNTFELVLRRARAYQASNPRSAVGYLREGDALFGKKRYAQAAKAYEQSLVTHYDSKAFAMMHTALVRAGNVAVAERKLSEVLARNPVDPDVLLFAGQYYMSVGRDREAIRVYEKVLPTVPNNFILFNNLAVLYQRQKDVRAANMAEKAYKIAPTHAGVMNTLGWILVDQGNVQRALPLLRDAVAKNPGSASWRYHYAVALAKSGKREDARRELRQALSGSGAFPEAEEAKSLLRAI